MFKEAFFGIKYALAFDGKLRWFLLALVVIYVVNTVLMIDATTSALTVLCAGLVISAEMFNTAIEHLCDRITIKKDYDIMLVKDMSAGAVLFLCFISVMVATYVYVPRILEVVF
jgi:undecaprenol kinase/diacylglycerol kinase (ATP)